MNETDRPHFVQLLVMLAEVFREPLADARLEGYWLALRDLPPERLEFAIHRTLETSRFFPRPAEIRAAAGAAVPDAGLVETLIMAHLRAPGGERRPIADPFLRLIVERMGGLRSIANMSSVGRLHVLERLLPGVIHAATVRGISMPSEASLGPPARRLALVQGG